MALKGNHPTMKLGIALSGGGVAGCAHIGVLLALEEAGIAIDCIAGSSSGAMIAALYSYGYSPSQLLDMLPAITKRYLDYDYKGILKKIFVGKKVRGMIKGEKLRGLIADTTGGAQMCDLKLPVCITATDLKNARQVNFVSRPVKKPQQDADFITDIPVADAVQASLSIPVLFQPVFFEDKVLIDGGLMDNCPVAPARALGADQVIAVDLNFTEPVLTPFDSLRSIFTRVLSINMSIKIVKSTKQADFIIRPDVGSVGILDFSKLEVCVEKGYESARKQMAAIRNSLEASSFAARAST